MEELVIKLDLKAVREVNEQTVDRWRDVKIPPVETNYENGIKAFPSKLVANLPLSEQVDDKFDVTLWKRHATRARHRIRPWYNLDAFRSRRSV